MKSTPWLDSKRCTNNEKVKTLGLDWIPEVVDIMKKHESSEPPKDTLPASDDAWK